jgi:hypothetical protein
MSISSAPSPVLSANGERERKTYSFESRHRRCVLGRIKERTPQAPARLAPQTPNDLLRGPPAEGDAAGLVVLEVDEGELLEEVVLEAEGELFAIPVVYETRNGALVGPVEIRIKSQRRRRRKSLRSHRRGRRRSFCFIRLETLFFSDKPIQPVPSISEDNIIQSAWEAKPAARVPEEEQTAPILVL